MISMLLIRSLILLVLMFASSMPLNAFAPATLVLLDRRGGAQDSLWMAGKGFGASNTKKPKESTASKSKAKEPVARDETSSSSSSSPPTEYPLMSREEISKWMSHIPVYAVTDPDGNTKAIQLGDRAVVYFFMSSIVADAYKEKLEQTSKESSTALTVSGLFLGNIWFDFLQLDLESSDATDYRLVPDPRDLTSARTVLSLETTTDSDIEESAMEHDNLEIVESAAFELPYDDIPLFYIDNMPLADKGEEIKQLLNQMVSSSYMFFSAQNMFRVLDKLKESGDSLEASNDALCSLHDVVDMMQQPSSTIDFRNILLIPPAPVEQGTISDAVLAKQLKDPSSLVSQSFFLPLLQES